MSFMTDRDAALWKEEFIGKEIRDSVAISLSGHTKGSSKA